MPPGRVERTRAANQAAYGPNALAMTVNCARFVELYSDFRDQNLDVESLVALDDHVRSCISCARYDRVVRGGVELLSASPQIEPSADFFPRLQHRIFHLEDSRAALGRRASGASIATLGIAAALTVAAWVPSFAPDAQVGPATVAAVAEPVPAQSAAYPIVTNHVPPILIHGPPAPALQGSGADLLLWRPNWTERSASSYAVSFVEFP